MNHVYFRDMWDVGSGGKNARARAREAERRQVKRLDRVRDLLLFQPRPTVNVQHSSPIKHLQLIIYPLALSIDHVQIPLTRIHPYHIHYQKCSLLRVPA